MKNAKSIFVLTSIFIAYTLPVQADIYKQTLPDGSVIFTDSPVEGKEHEKVKLKPMATIPAVDPASANYTPPEKTESVDFSIAINSPASGSTFRNADADSIALLVAITPKTSSKHSVKITLDGKSIAPQDQALPPQNRGEHHLTVEVFKGNQVVSTASSTFYVHRYSAKH